RYSNIKSGIRIALRTLACILLSMLVFFGGFYLQYVVGVAPYVSGLLSWLLFGLGIGLIISASSTIARMNGIIGGVIGAVIAFQVYWGLTEFLNTGFLLANLASMLLMGGIIGSILVSVVTTLEDYELEVIAPAGYQRTVPISKWLNAGESVMIGKLPGSYVYVKWDDDEVRPEHAEMFREDSSIFVRPVEEVLVNQRMISKPVALKNGDIIKLGRSSITQFRFVEK
ncbi:MAG: FHA domain-containing protein, partial [Saprospiraceae bacterium]